MKKNLPKDHHSIQAIIAVSALALALTASAGVARAQAAITDEQSAHNVAVDHSAMHAPLDFSENSEVGEAASLVSIDSPTAVTVSNFAFSPGTITIPQGETVRWDFQDNTTHTATDNTALLLFDSGNKTAGDSFSFLFRSAGIYPYHCEIHGSMQGAVQVPIQVSPASGDTTTPFTITWSATPAAAGFVFDVQIKRPGASSFSNWKMGQTKRLIAFKPGAGPGKYSFRARLRKVSNNAHSLYSPFRTITVGRLR